MSEHKNADKTDLTSLQTVNQRLKSIIEAKTAGKPIHVWGVTSKVLRSRKGYVHCHLRQGSFSLACYVPAEIVQTLPFWIEEGQTLGVRGEISLHAPWAEVQIVAQQVELQLPATEDEALEALKRRAKAAGWLDPARKRPLPRPPHAVGLVVGKRSRARKDVMGSLQDAGLNPLLILQEAPMHGTASAAPVRSALTALNAKPDVDVIVIARGGGSKSELNLFNDWDLAQAIVQSRVPVVTAIGHRQDQTLADLVADRSIPTPSLVGNALAPDRPRDRPLPKQTRTGPSPISWVLVLAVGAVLLTLLLILLTRVF